MADVVQYSLQPGPQGTVTMAPAGVVDSSTFPPGHCRSDSPHLGCPVNAVRNAAILTAAMLLFGAKPTTALAAGVAAWYAASGLWWA